MSTVMWYRRRPGQNEWVKIEVVAPMPPYTDEELAALKLMGEELTIADWDRMTPAQKLKEQSEWLARLWAVNGNINLMDPIDPAWVKKDTDDEGDDYRTEHGTNY